MSIDERLSLNSIQSAQSSEETLQQRVIRSNLVNRLQEPKLNATKWRASYSTGTPGIFGRYSVPSTSQKSGPSSRMRSQSISIPRRSFAKFWMSVANTFIPAPRAERSTSYSAIEDGDYSLTKPELMDDDLDIDYPRWKKRACCHQFSIPKLEQHFWTFYIDNHANTIRITFMAFLAFPILGWIWVDIIQKGVSEMFYKILYLRMVWSLVIVLFLLFFYIGNLKPDAVEMNQMNDLCKGEVTSTSTISVRQMLVVPLAPWYIRVGVLTVSHTSYFVFAVSFVSCMISILISYMGNQPSHKPYIILFLAMHIFLGMGNNFCSFLCWMTTLLFCIINFLLVESPFKTCGYVVGVSVILTVMGEFLEFSYRKLFYKRRELELQQFKNDLMLTTVVPPRIAIQLKRGEREAVSYNYEKPIWGASVLFCQICDFEQLSNDLPAAALVNYLNKVFTYMDRLSTKNKVYKVETVKEVYMAACGLPAPNADHMNQIAHFALDIKEYLIDKPEKLAVQFRTNSKCSTLKIGIHCGTVIAGVIGKLCPRYRLFGDTVNVAARMETNSKKGMIQISERFREKIDGSVFLTLDRGFIKIKGKDPMHTYFLTGRNTKLFSGESLLHLGSSGKEADNGISILKFCFDKSKLDDVDMESYEYGRSSICRTISRRKLQRTLSGQIDPSSFNFNKSFNRKMSFQA